MKAAIYNIETTEIMRFVDCSPAFIPKQCNAGEEFFLNCPIEATNIINNEAVRIEPTLDTKQLVKPITDYIQFFLDETARTHNYDNMVSLVSYANSTDPLFKAEAEAGIAWRDACWRYAYNAFAEIQAGNRTLPTPQEAILELPTIVWPTN